MIGQRRFRNKSPEYKVHPVRLVPDSLGCNRTEENATPDMVENGAPSQ